MMYFNMVKIIITCFFTACHLLLCVTYAGEAAQRLNGTGIGYGGNYPKGINAGCVAKVESFAVTSAQAKSFVQQQDCATGSSTFHYRKVDAAGKILPEGAQQWHCVIDEVSGLMWEVKHADEKLDNLHFFGDKFTWYNSNPKHNGRNIGDWNQRGVHCHGYTQGKPRSYCHVEQFVSRVNKQGLCGFKDWRLPSRAELTSLIHFGEFQPAINRDYFPHTLSNFYWAYNPVVGRPIEAWSINFEFGYASPLRKTDVRPARLVRANR
jgi:hypothetical protein